MSDRAIEFVEVAGGIRLACHLTGNGEQCLVVPFLCYVLEDWSPLEPGRRVLYVDRRSRGASDTDRDPARLTAKQGVEDLEAVREHFGLETLALCGWSQGGLGAALYTVTHPERVDRLILIGSVGPQRIRYDGTDEAEAAGSARIRDDERAELDAMRDAERVEPVAFSRRFLRVIMSYQMADFTCAERMRSDPHRYPNEWPENLHPLSEATARAWMDVEFHPGSIRAPTLVIHGEGDVIPLAAARDWLRYADDARLLVVPGSGHWPWLERPDVFFPALQNFLR